MRHLFDRPLGAFAPNGSLFKCDVYSLAAAGLNLAGNIATNQINAERAASDMATYLNLVHKQRDWQKEDQLWSEGMSKRLMDYQNEYNSPVAQMARYKAAGVNPYLMMQENSVGSGNSQSMPSPNPSVRAAVSPFQRPALDNVSSSVADKLFNASALKSQRIASLAQFAKAIPEIVKGTGTRAKDILSSIFGGDIDTHVIDTLTSIEVARQRIAQQREDLKLQIENEFGRENAFLINQNLVYEGQKIINEASELYSKKRLDEASIKEVITRAAKNVAEASHLNADTKTIDQLRPFVVKSANMQADMDEYDKIESETDFEQRREARAWQRSPEGHAQATASQTISDNGETNLVNKILHAKDPSRRGSHRR